MGTRPDYVPRAWRGSPDGPIQRSPFLVLLVLLTVTSFFATAVVAALAASHFTFAVILAALGFTFARNLWVYGPRAYRAWRRR